jgi:hypothetical protein
VKASGRAWAAVVDPDEPLPDESLEARTGKLGERASQPCVQPFALAPSIHDE